MSSEETSRPRRSGFQPAADAGVVAGGSGTDLGMSRPQGESPVELLVRALEAHETAEQETLAEYERLLDVVRDPAVKVLMRLLVEDEQRHHDLLRGMATTLRDGVRWAHSAGALALDIQPGESDDEQLLKTTRMRLREERHGVREFRELAREHHNLHDGLFALLFEIMALDSEKHERILSYIEQKLESRD